MALGEIFFLVVVCLWRGEWGGGGGEAWARGRVGTALQHIGKKAGPKDPGRGLMESIIGVYCKSYTVKLALDHFLRTCLTVEALFMR